jgi:ribosomal protein S18 acetylase RimI-like enzyme
VANVSETVVEIAHEATPELLAAMHHLVPQLSSSAAPMTMAELTEIVSSPATVLLLARNEGTIVGALTLATFRIPTGVRAWIEDVVVDGAARGLGAGAALNRAAIAIAQERGARTVELTSRPSREAANQLYLKLGFKTRETNVYRYDG